jgi:hypothetical protein
MHRSRNLSYDANKRRDTISQRYSEGGKVSETNAQVETRNHAQQEEQ